MIGYLSRNMVNFSPCFSGTRWCVTLLVLLAALSMGRQSHAQTVDSAFVAVPDSVLPLLDRNARLDLLDYANAGMEAKVTNLMDGTTWLTEKTDSTVTLQLTPVSQWQLCLVPCSDGGVCYVVRQTFFLPEPYCREVRYDGQWHVSAD